MAKKKESAERSSQAEVEDVLEAVIDDELDEVEEAPRKTRVRRPSVKEDKGKKPEKADDKGSSSRPVRKVTQAPVKKAKATKKRDESVEVSSGRTTPWGFIRQSVSELKKVVWPKGDTIGQYFVVVLVFVLIVMTIVAGLDTFFGWGLMQILGGS